MRKDWWIYLLIRTLTYPFSLMPYTWLHFIGRQMGKIAYYCMRDYRKRALSNLALASDLKLTAKDLIKLAKKSFQNLAINCLEYPRLAREKNFPKIIHCDNPEIATELATKGQGIIFFCGHQSNWEVLFLDGTSRMNGIAIGKPIKNKWLYNWIVSIREKNGGKIISPRNAVREGLRSLRKGAFIGIVGDQGMPNSGYSFPFLGRRAWTSTAPALLAYKTNSPIIFAETKRVKGGYRIKYSQPIWPDQSQSGESEVTRMMDLLLTQFQESIKKSPGEWLWQHNRWKQQTPQNVYKPFRHDCICVVLPEENEDFYAILPHLPTLKLIYNHDFLFLIVPEKYRNISLIQVDDIFYYSTPREMLLEDYRFKMIFNFTRNRKVKKHFEKLSVFKTLDLPELRKLAAPYLDPSHNLSDLLKRALCRPGSLWNKEETQSSAC